MFTVIDEDYLFKLLQEQNFSSVLHITNEDLLSIFSEDVLNYLDEERTKITMHNYKTMAVLRNNMRLTNDWT